MSVFVNGRWAWYRPEWSENYRDYVDRQRVDGARLQPTITCRKCHEQHMDPHLNKCASEADKTNPLHEPDWGTP